MNISERINRCSSMSSNTTFINAFYVLFDRESFIYIIYLFQFRLRHFFHFSISVTFLLNKSTLILLLENVLFTTIIKLHVLVMYLSDFIMENVIFVIICYPHVSK